jgi:hypothetical protein
MDRKRHGRAVIFGLISVTAVALFLWIAPPRTHTRENLIGVQARDVFVFEALPEMVATSDVVVEASVAEVRTGQVIPVDEDHSMGFREAVLHLESILFVRPSSGLRLTLDDQLVLEELASDSGTPVIVNNVQPSEVGDRGFYFLTLQLTRPSSSSPHERVKNTLPAPGRRVAPYVDLASSQGRYLIQDGSLVGSNQEDPFVKSIQSLSPEVLRVRILEARAAFYRGEVQPHAVEVCPPPGCPEDLEPETTHESSSRP